MKLIDACKDILGQLSDVIDSIRPEDFKREEFDLNNSIVGQHIRYILEFFTCWINNHTTGFINYNERGYNKAIENIPLTLAGDYDFGDKVVTRIYTNLRRELAFNIEYVLHKIELRVIATYVTIPSHFGVTVSTIRYQNKYPSLN